MAILSSNNCCSYNSFLPQLTPPKLPTLTIASTRPHFKTVKHTQLCFEIKKTMKKKKKNMKAVTLMTSLLLLCGFTMVVIVRYFGLQWWWLQVLNNPLLSKLLLCAILFRDPMMVAPTLSNPLLGGLSL